MLAPGTLAAGCAAGCAPGCARGCAPVPVPAAALATGKPLARSSTVPSSSSAAAWLCRRAGCSLLTCRSSARVSPAHRPLPLICPASRALAALVVAPDAGMPGAAPPANTSLTWSSVSLFVWRGVPLACRLMLRSGSRPLSQAPGSWLSSVMLALAGLSSPLLCNVALPVKAVRGRLGSSAARSSCWVCRVSSPSGQVAKGSSVARAESDVLAGLPAGAAAVLPAARCQPSSWASAASRASGPFSVSLADQGCSPARWACRLACTGSGALVPICAAPVSVACCQTSDRPSTRCSPPRWAPSCRLAATSVMGASASTCSWLMRRASTCRASGSCRSVGAAAVVVAGPPL